MKHTPRERIEAVIERLIALLDTMDGDTDAEPSLCGVVFGRGDDRDPEHGCEDEGEIDSGVGDLDGLKEQHPQLFQYADQRVE